MSQTINIIEPTLTTETGHCFSFIESLCSANPAMRFSVWMNYAASLDFSSKNTVINKYFFRKMRKLQCVFLYRKLLNTSDKILIATAGRFDLVIFDWISRKTIPPNKVYFYFHWMNESHKKLAYLKKLAIKQPNLVMLGPTPSIIKIFETAGFKQAHVVPYPIAKITSEEQPVPQTFKNILFAGVARQDKGFGHVVDLIQQASQQNLTLPFTLQVSPDHHGQYDVKTKADIVRLSTIQYDYLERLNDTLSKEWYAKIFLGAICLQPYNEVDFSDRISGVTLDALSFGSPIVTTGGTWIARQVERFDAGIVAKSTAPTDLLLAIEKVIAEYSYYNHNALQASQILQDEHNANHLACVFEG